MRTFDDIYILDLHGNSLKEGNLTLTEVPTKTSSISGRAWLLPFSSLTRHGNQDRDARKYITKNDTELRQVKYDWLDAHDHSRTDWLDFNPSFAIVYLFIPRRRRI